MSFLPPGSYRPALQRCRAGCRIPRLPDIFSRLRRAVAAPPPDYGPELIAEFAGFVDPGRWFGRLANGQHRFAKHTEKGQGSLRKLPGAIAWSPNIWRCFHRGSENSLR